MKPRYFKLDFIDTRMREEKAFSHDGNGKGLWPRIMLTSDFIA